MKLFKQTNDARDSYSRRVERMETYGFIVKRKVDEFNDKIKVFKPIADWSSESSHWSNNDNVRVYEEGYYNEWRHLSTVKLEPATKKDVKRVRNAIEERIKSHTDDVIKLSQTLDNLDLS